MPFFRRQAKTQSSQSLINDSLIDQAPILSTQTVHFKALDAFELVGTLYTPSNIIRAKIVVSSATGVPQAFYRRFSEYATQLGYQVLTFDYRGVGKSAPKNLTGFEMSYLD